MDKSKDSKPEKTKKRRQRMKSVYFNIRNQMEFYFSDANLRKDRFIKKAIDATSDGYISLETFLTFNKIKVLTEDAHVLAEAIHNKSQILQVNEEKTHVRRTTPIQCDVNVDDRTVYVECLPHNIDHEWVRKVFAACGKVAYVSLPRYASTGDLKGFAFIEFESPEGAEAACKELNNPPADFIHRIGMFPKSSHQLDALKKKLPADQVKETEEKAKELLETVEGEEMQEDEREKVDKKDATEVLPESNNDKKSAEEAEQDTKAAKNKRRQTASETECTPSPAKRKKSAEVSFNLPEKDSDDETRTTSSGKKKGKKRKNRSRTSEDNDSSKDESGIEKSDFEIPAKKARVGESVVKSNESEIKENEKNGSENVSEVDKNVKNKANKPHRKRLRRKHAQGDKEIPELRVIPKTEWLKLRSEYLKLQKTSMAMLKKSLRNTQSIADDMQSDHKPPPSKQKSIEFVADVIVKVHSEAPLRRKQLKENFGEDVKVAYIDIADDNSEGYIRCEDAISARAIAEKKMEGLTFTLVSGEDEKQYWDKLASDRESKLSKKCRHKKRGHQKWMEKAQKASIENWERKHVVFDDE